MSMATTTPATMPVKQVEAMKRGERDSGELAIADPETRSRGGSDRGEQALLAAHANVRRLTDERNVETVIDAAD